MDITEPKGSSTTNVAESAPISDTIGEAAPQQPDRTGIYELMVIFPATYAEEELPAMFEKVKNQLTEFGAVVTTAEDFGKRKLAFPIKHVRQGYYQIISFQAPKTSVQKIDNALQLAPEVLRHLMTIKTVKTKEQIEAKQALRERIHAKRAAAEERAIAERQKTERAAAPPPVVEPSRKVSEEELSKKLEEILTDTTLGV
jgi:small subunit ribosomal protein S6